MIRLFSAAFYFVWLVIIAALIYGWMLNLIKIIETASDPITGMFIARLFGVIAFFLGAVLGYF